MSLKGAVRRAAGQVRGAVTRAGQDVRRTAKGVAPFASAVFGPLGGVVSMARQRGAAGGGPDAGADDADRQYKPNLKAFARSRAAGSGTVHFTEKPEEGGYA